MRNNSHYNTEKLSNFSIWNTIIFFSDSIKISTYTDTEHFLIDKQWFLDSECIDDDNLSRKKNNW